MSRIRICQFILSCDILMIHLLHRHGPFNYRASLSICKQLSDAIDHLHGQSSTHGRLMPVIHRDIKPENVLIQHIRYGRKSFVSRKSADGSISPPPVPSNDRLPVEDVIVVISDFGFAKQMKSATETFTTLLGTPGFMAPEVQVSDWNQICVVLLIFINIYIAVSVNEYVTSIFQEFCTFCDI